MNWNKAFRIMNELADRKTSASGNTSLWKYGQEATIKWVASQLSTKGRKGVLVADEVGMGKTRVVMAAILSVLKSGGTVAAVVPPGLLYQWEKEWDDFIKSVSGSKTRQAIDYSPMLLRSYNSLFTDSSLQYPLSTNNGKWLLLSHQFGLPMLRNQSPLYKYSLPILAAAIRKRKDGVHQRNRFWQVLKENGWDYDCLDENCNTCSERRQQSC